jgi:hypothetical protein
VAEEAEAVTRKTILKRRAYKMAWPLFKYARRVTMLTLNYIEACRIATEAAQRLVPAGFAEGGVIPIKSVEAVLPLFTSESLLTVEQAGLLFNMAGGRH